MNIDIIEVGELYTNCYILTINDDVLVIDPGDEYFKIKDKIKDKNLLGILITHRHFDHIGALDQLVNEYNVDVYDINNLKEEEYKIGNFNFRVVYTKGHTDDSITFNFYKDKVMFCGDFIFKDTIGRCDFANSSISDMKNSIEKIKTYDDDIIIYPGHGPKTTLGYEKNNFKYYYKFDR